MIDASLVRVLVVDDDSRVRQALRHLLDGVPELECLAVDSGQAMRLASWHSPVADVAVIDMPPPSFGRTTLIGRLSVLMPVLVLSMSGSARQAALAAGADRFVEKDGDSASLVDAIRAAVAQPREVVPRPVGLGQNGHQDT